MYEKYVIYTHVEQLNGGKIEIIDIEKKKKWYSRKKWRGSERVAVKYGHSEKDSYKGNNEEWMVGVHYVNIVFVW